MGTEDYGTAMSGFEQAPSTAEGSNGSPKSPTEPKDTREAIDKWMKKIHLSKALREKVAADYTWKDIIDEYHGKYN
jgi:hypothetical protein